MSFTVTEDNLPRLEQTLEALEGVWVAVGFAGTRDDGLSNAQLAYIHEHGSPLNNIPARPFFEPGLAEGRPEIEAVARQATKRALDQGTEQAVVEGAKMMGLAAENAVKRKILTGKFVPLKPATIKRKGHSKPLIDTGQLYDSITSQVRLRRGTS
jgi:hypothetical protein